MTEDTSPFCPDCGGTGLNDWERQCASCEGTGAPEPPLGPDNLLVVGEDGGLLPLTAGCSGDLLRIDDTAGLGGDLHFKAGEGPDGNGNIILEGPIKIDDNDETLQETLQRQEGEIAFLKGMLMKLVDG